MRLIPALLLVSSALSLSQPAVLAQAKPAPASSVALIPMPREVHLSGTVSLANGIRVEVPGDGADDKFAAQDLISSLPEHGVKSADGGASVTVTLLRASSPAAKTKLASLGVAFSPAMQSEGYVLSASGTGVTIIGGTASGVYYGVQTLKQLIVMQNGEPVLETGKIRDWPAMKYRGMDDDLSRGPVPTLEFQKKQVRTIAAYKLNVYSPYFESNYGYAVDPLVGLPDGAMTPADARELVAYAAKYHVMIVPEQEAFGHLHHILLWEKYATEAEAPFGSVIAPGQPNSLADIQRWFTELSQVFPAPILHVGADETVELGQGQTKSDVDARGLNAVYLDFMTKIFEQLKPLNRKVAFWGDIAVHSPELIKKLPPDMIHGMIALPWRYGIQTEGFTKDIKPFTDAGMETWVSPGVSNWSRVYPNNNTALLNIQGFVRDGQRLGADGMLNTVWNDDGEGLFNMDWYGVLFGAAASWQPGESSIPQFESSFGQVFHGDSTGKINQAHLELMAAHTLLQSTGVGDGNDSLFWADPWSEDGQALGAKLRPILHDLRLHAENALTLIAQARAAGNLRENDALDAMDLGARRFDFIGLKFELSDQMILGYQKAYQEQLDPANRSDVSRQLGRMLGTNGFCEDLRDGYSLTRDIYEHVWLTENRPYWLHNNLALYDKATQLWLNRIDKLKAARAQWTTAHVLPPAASLGMPENLESTPPPPTTTASR